MSGLPPKADEAVFAVNASVVIDAPIDKVWGILLDFPSYPEWWGLPFYTPRGVRTDRLACPQELVRVGHDLRSPLLH